MAWMTCVRDFEMEGGCLAFRAGYDYQWRFASEEELAAMGAAFVFKSDIGENHFMNYSDVQEAFLGEMEERWLRKSQ